MSSSKDRRGHHQKKNRHQHGASGSSGEEVGGRKISFAPDKGSQQSFDRMFGMLNEMNRRPQRAVDLRIRPRGSEGAASASIDGGGRPFADHFLTVGLDPKLVPLHAKNLPRASSKKKRGEAADAEGGGDEERPDRQKLLKTPYFGKVIFSAPKLPPTIPPHIWMFCLPHGVVFREEPAEPCLFPFVVTTNDGSKLYGACVTLYQKFSSKSLPGSEEWGLYAPNTFCVLSHKAYYLSARHWMCTFYRAVRDSSSKPLPLPLEAYVRHLISDVRLPARGARLTFRGVGGREVIALRVPAAREFPLLQIPFSYLFRALSVPNVLQALACVLQERRLLLVSKHMTLLTFAAETLSALMHPFNWQYIYVPILPRRLLSFVRSNTPFIMGIHPDYLEASEREELLEQLVIVDLDNDRVEIRGERSALPPLAGSVLQSELEKLLRPSLDCLDSPAYQPSNGQLEDPSFDVKVRLAFLRFFVTLFGDHRRFFRYVRVFPKPLVHFAHTAFLETHASLMRLSGVARTRSPDVGSAQAASISSADASLRFVKTFLNTQTFAHFCQRYGVPRNSLFERCVQDPHLLDDPEHFLSPATCMIKAPLAQESGTATSAGGGAVGASATARHSYEGFPVKLSRKQLGSPSSYDYSGSEYESDSEDDPLTATSPSPSAKSGAGAASSNGGEGDAGHASVVGPLSDFTPDEVRDGQERTPSGPYLADVPLALQQFLEQLLTMDPADLPQLQNEVLGVFEAFKSAKGRLQFASAIAKLHMPATVSRLPAAAADPAVVKETSSSPGEGAEAAQSSSAGEAASSGSTGELNGSLTSSGAATPRIPTVIVSLISALLAESHINEDFHTPQIILKAAMSNFTVLGQSWQQLSDEVRDQDIWQSLPFWAVKLNSCIEEECERLYNCSILKRFREWPHLPHKKQEEYVHREQVMVAFHMIKTAKEMLRFGVEADALPSFLEEQAILLQLPASRIEKMLSKLNGALAESVAEKEAEKAAAAERSKLASEQEDAAQSKRIINMGLTDEDWAILTQQATITKFKKDFVILDAGASSHALYKVKRGKVRMEKKFPNGEIRSSFLERNRCFGEMSILDSEAKTAVKVIADSSDVELYVLQLDTVYKLFAEHPDMPFRFFKFLASKLAEVIKQHKGNKARKQKSKSKSLSSSAAVGIEIKPESEDHEDDVDPDHLIATFECSLKSKFLKKHGRLYVTKDWLCFISEIFRTRKRDLLMFRGIKILEKKKEGFQVVCNKKSYFFRFNNNEGSDAFFVISSAMNAWKRGLTSAGPNGNKEKPASPFASSADEEEATDPETDTEATDEEYMKRGSQALTITESRIKNSPPGLSLDEDDWNLILQGAQCITYFKDAVIIREGTVRRRIIQIGSGRVRIEKSVREDGRIHSVVLGRMGAGEVMGEINLIEGKGATASVIADDVVVDVYVMGGSYINALIEIRRGFGGRFFHYICSEMLSRLRARLETRK
eukprot:CAMPEP_0177641060 /NCGR_PEP_ID=MMETSP0447-20121125/6871_1 /TAXON_ID=0 /ORGANISM="Stygamoeba regulata, Strain BSH-02190019" /LENGTH=1472 /DNA_ID=CAMNT_0019143165 /DNA_START=192 /DNA_END=4610 /DNA_ORIENTATION=+